MRNSDLNAFLNVCVAMLVALCLTACANTPTSSSALPVSATVSAAPVAGPVAAQIDRGTRNCLLPQFIAPMGSNQGRLYAQFTRSADTEAYQVQVERRQSNNDTYAVTAEGWRRWTLPTPFEALLPPGVYRLTVKADCSEALSNTVILSVGGGGAPEGVPPVTPAPPAVVPPVTGPPSTEPPSGRPAPPADGHCHAATGDGLPPCPDGVSP